MIIKQLPIKLKAILFSLLSLVFALLTLFGWASLKKHHQAMTNPVVKYATSQPHQHSIIWATPTLFLIAGLIFSALAAGIFYLFMLSYLRSRENRQHLHQKQFIKHYLNSINKANSVDASRKKLLQILAKSLDWPIAHIYQVSEKQLKSTNHWYVKKSIKRQYQEFITLVNTTLLNEGQTLPEQSLQRKEPTWLAQASSDQRVRLFNYHNKGIALQSGFAFPLFDQHGQIKNIIELYSPALKAEDDHLGELIDTLAIQASQILYQREIEETVKLSETHRALILNSASEGIYGINAAGEITFANPVALKKLGYKASELVGQKGLALIHTQPPSAINRCLKQNKSCLAEETNLQCKDGSIIPIEFSCTPVLHNGEAQSVIIIFSDLTQQKEQAKTIQMNSLLMNSLIKIQEDYIAGKEPQPLYEDILHILMKLSQSRFGFIANFQNKAEPSLLILAISEPSFINSSNQTSTKPPLQTISIEKLPATIKNTLRKANITIDNSPQFDYFFASRIKNYLGIPIYGKNGLIGMACLTDSELNYDDNLVKSLLPIIHSLASITEANAASTQLKKMANHDPLTGAYNLSYFDKVLNQHFLQARRTNEFFALLTIDLDGLNEINSNYGYQVGDKLLKAFTERIQHASNNGELIARVGGNVFTLLCTQANSAHAIGRYANLLIKLLTQPYKINTYRLTININIGISCFPIAAKTREKLFKSLNTALERARAKGKNCYQFYHKSIQAEHERKITIESDVFSSAKLNQLFLVYQPQFNLETTALVGFEALVRWQHPSLGLVGPDEFVPLLENSKKVHEFGFWIIEQALKDLKLLEQHMLSTPFKIAINVASRQIQPRFVNELKTLLLKHQAHASRIELELTESSLINHIEISPILEKLRTLGISIAIDDFGTGYSSLTRLKDIPADILKIDKSFVLNSTECKDSQYIIENTIDLAHKLNLKTIAEGVETKEHINLLKRLNCHLAQGYYFARPQTLDKIIQWLTSRKPSNKKSK